MNAKQILEILENLENVSFHHTGFRESEAPHPSVDTQPYFPLYDHLFPDLVRVWRGDHSWAVGAQGILSTSALAGIEKEDLNYDRFPSLVAVHYVEGGRERRRMPTPFISCSPNRSTAERMAATTSGVVVEALVPREQLIIPEIGGTNAYDSSDPQWQLRSREFLILGSLKPEWICGTTSR